MFVCPSLVSARRIAKYTPDMRREDVDRSFLSALKMWSDAAPLRFIKVDGGQADIVLSFARRSKAENHSVALDTLTTEFFIDPVSFESFLLQLMEISSPSTAPVECWLTPFSQDRGQEEMCTLTRMKHGRRGGKVGHQHRQHVHSSVRRHKH